MGKEKLSGTLLAAGAVMEFIVAVLHFIWPSFFIQLNIMNIKTGLHLNI
jgi:hypothetical protein